MTAAAQISQTQTWAGNQSAQPLPTPTGPYPYRKGLNDFLGPTLAAARPKDHLTLHVIGDSGGIKQPASQQLVADTMVKDLASSDPPTFCFHVGDLVYFDGEQSQYYPQFYEPYQHYTPPILGIPGNHDGDPVPGDSSLSGFVRNLCAPAPVILPESADAPRLAATQPNVYWTLIDDHVTIIGLYSNVPSGGEIDQTQLAWLAEELQAAPADRPLIVALHHPPYSGDAHHGGSAHMGALLDGAFARASRFPDMVLSGHVHDQQRFTRTMSDGRQIPYLVVGNSGYWHLHPFQSGITFPFDTGNGVTLETGVADRHGFLRLTVSPTGITGEFITCPRPQESWSNGPVAVSDAFVVDTGAHTVKTVQSTP